MKKYFILISAALLALAGCSKEVSMTSTSCTFEVNADQVATKAAIDGDGAGANVDRFIMEVYLNKNGELKLFDRQVAAPTSMSPAKTKFTLTLVKDQEYDVLFWADKCGASLEEDLYYDTADLREVKINGTYVGNDDARDAFSKMEVITPEMSRNGFSKTIKLTRPFAQVNFITTDIDEIMKTSSADEFLPTNVKTEFYGFTKFNVLDQTASEPAAFVSEAAVYSKTTPAETVTEYTLSMDYVLTLNATEKEMHDLVLTAYAGDYELTKVEVANAPVQRNYRTNVKGNLLTSVNEFVVEVDPIWNDPDFEVEVVSPWNGSVEEVPAPDENNTIHITTAGQLAGISAAVANGTTFAGKTVVLDSDIDLNNVAWTPIGNVAAYPGKTFNGTFDGNGKVISNLNVTDKSANHAAAGLFGSHIGTIQNVTVKGATIVSSHYAAVICAYTSANNDVIDNCVVEDATILSVPELVGDEYDNGDKVGAIMGYMTSGCKITNCVVKNTTIEAHRDLGVIVGCAINGAAAGVTDNQAIDCTVIQSNVNAYKTNVTTYGEIIGRHNNDVPASNVAENVVLKVYTPKNYLVEGIYKISETEAGIDSPAGLVNLASYVASIADPGYPNIANYSVVLDSDLDMTGVNWVMEDLTSAPRVKMVIDGQNHTISGLNLTSDSGNIAMYNNLGGNNYSGGMMTIKNLVLANSSFVSTAAGSYVGGLAVNANSFKLENVSATGCTLEAKKYAGVFIAYDSDGSSSPTIDGCKVENCTLKAVAESGSTSVGAFFGYTQTPHTLTNCSISGNTITGVYAGGFYGTLNCNGTFNSCTVNGEAASAANVAGRALGTVNIN